MDELLLRVVNDATRDCVHVSRHAHHALRSPAGSARHAHPLQSEPRAHFHFLPPVSMPNQHAIHPPPKPAGPRPPQLRLGDRLRGWIQGRSPVLEEEELGCDEDEGVVSLSAPHTLVFPLIEHVVIALGN